MSMGQEYIGPRAYRAHTKPLNLDDLACPTFGFSDEFITTLTADNGDVYRKRARTVG